MNIMGEWRRIHGYASGRGASFGSLPAMLKEDSMFAWFRKMSERAQRKNVERTIEMLVRSAQEADGELLQGRAPSPAVQARVASNQRSLLVDLIGPVSLDELRDEYLRPLVSDDRFSDGVVMAVQHVFDMADRSGRRKGLEILDWEVFKDRVSGGWGPRMDMSIYQSLSFECACGEAHLFAHAAPLKELPGMRLVLSCPALNASGTCVKIEGLFRIRIESEFGAK